MPAFFIELFSEEIPARMQARAADELSRLVAEALKPLNPRDDRRFYGPRRIALALELDAAVPETKISERGPRTSAPEQALAGFLRKHGASKDDLRQEGDFWVLEKSSPAIAAAGLIASAMPGLLRRFSWPKSMRWGGTSSFTWVRPLRRIVCLLDGDVVPFDLANPSGEAGGDNGHGIASGNLTEGHRFHHPGAVEVSSAATWEATLRARHVIADQTERRAKIEAGVTDVALASGYTVVPDSGLIDEVTGLVEWPVPLVGRIDAAFMDLPPEVMQVSMRVNQRYFALRRLDATPAPAFAFVANIAAHDGGKAIIAGNERVLRARFADARHFWDLDRKTKLADRVAALEKVTYHARLGSQRERVRRIEHLAGAIATLIGADVTQAKRAALLAKADLTTGMVGEFPELQGVMGGYYAAHHDEHAAVAAAIRDHYSPRGADDEVPDAPVTVAVALADKLDQLTAFFAIGEKPTGSGDPFALRRAALGVIRIIRLGGFRIPLRGLVQAHVAQVADSLRSIGAAPVADAAQLAEDVLDFIADRLRVQLRTEGARHDVLTAVFAAGADDDLTRVLARTDALAAMLGTDDGLNLLAAYKRAANILRIEEKKDGPHNGAVDAALLEAEEERVLASTLRLTGPAIHDLLTGEDYAGAMTAMAQLRAPLDPFFDRVTVNAPQPALRSNRLRLLHQLRAVMDRAADFSRIES